MIRAVIFDLGKVLVDFDYGIAARKIAGQCKTTAEDIGRFIGATPLLLRYETGLLTDTEFYREICAATGFPGDVQEFGNSFADIFTPIEPMVALHAEIRERGLPTYVFSNTNSLAISHIRRNFPFFANFDGYIFSFEHGCMKPDPRLYEVIERQSGRRGPELLYLDDRPENLVTAEQRGWQVIHHESPEKTRARIEQLLRK